jgi:ketosteroid isomerase-like protein
MSQEHVELVRRANEAWNRRDWITVSALWRSDGVIDWSRARGPFKGVYRGERERQAFFEDFWSTFQYVQLESTTSWRLAPRSWSRTPPTCGAAMGSR